MEGRVKGSCLMTVVKELRERRDHAEPLVDADLRSYFDELLLVTKWYPETHYRRLLQVLSHFVPGVERDPWRWLGRKSAGVDLVEIYYTMVDRSNPWATLERLPRLWKLFHDSGSADVGYQGPNRAQVLIRDYVWLDDRFGSFQAGYMEKMLRLSGATGIQVRVLDSGRFGVRSARWQATWSA
ncbi:MAG: DUF2378 family protein [Thermoanaerobaculia bacterium]|nr:DUF2378 family protein [Thermoanaerobaculia bacterium]